MSIKNLPRRIQCVLYPLGDYIDAPFGRWEKDGKDKKPDFRMINFPQLRPLKTKTSIQQHLIQLLSWLYMFFFSQQPNEGYLIISQSSWWVSIYGKEIIPQKQKMMSTDFLAPASNRVLSGNNPPLSLPKQPVHTSRKASQASRS